MKVVASVFVYVAIDIELACNFSETCVKMSIIQRSLSRDIGIKNLKNLKFENGNFEQKADFNNATGFNCSLLETCDTLCARD